MCYENSVTTQFLLYAYANEADEKYVLANRGYDIYIHSRMITVFGFRQFRQLGLTTADDDNTPVYDHRSIHEAQTNQSIDQSIDAWIDQAIV